MASFKICVRVKRHDGLYPVYIRITHDRQIGYIKTDKCVDKEEHIIGANSICDLAPLL